MHHDELSWASAVEHERRIDENRDKTKMKRQKQRKTSKRKELPAPVELLNKEKEKARVKHKRKDRYTANEQSHRRTERHITTRLESKGKRGEKRSPTPEPPPAFTLIIITDQPKMRLLAQR